MPNGPYLLCFDGSEAAARAIHAAAGLVGSGHPSAVIYVYKPTERSLGVAQALTGGSIDAPVSGETDAHAVLDAGMAVARDAGFAPSPLLVAADRRVAEIITAKAEEHDAPAIVMGQRGRSALKTAILGSVSRDVVNAFHRPIILV